MKQIAFTLILFLGISSGIYASKNLTETIRANYIRLLLPSTGSNDLLMEALLRIPPEIEVSDQAVTELHQRYPLNKEKILFYIETLQPDGSWPDIDYADPKRSGWEPKQHAERVLEMTKYKYCQPAENNITEQLTGAIHTALNYWFREKPVCNNWWQNQIGIPKTFGPTFLLLKEEFSPEELEEAIAVMAKAQIGMTGQNKVWLAGNVLIKALLEENDKELIEARNAIFGEITLGAKEGIKSDWSFHQHGPQQQFGNYGLTFLTEMSFYSNLFAGTPLAMNSQQQSILNNYLLQGYRWINWKGYMDINALARQLYHNVPLHKALSTGFAARSLMANSMPNEKAELQKYIEDNFLPDSTTNFTGHKHFWDSDLTIHRTPNWMASVKMASARVIGTELVNEDNLKGYYMADGATYIYHNGDEYLNIFPLWDWRKIPGITSYDNTEPIPTDYTNSRNHTEFVGGITDGTTGMTAMILNRDGVYAKKSWIFTDLFVLCLGSDIQTNRNIPLATSIDQRLKKGPLLQYSRTGWKEVVGTVRTEEGENRFYHNGTGYFILSTPVTAITEERCGRWHDFMGMYKPATVSGEVISLYIEHSGKEAGSYQYILLPDVTQKMMETFYLPTIRILQNDKKIQAARYDNKIYCTAYEHAHLTVDENTEIAFPVPGIYLLTWDGKNWKMESVVPDRRK